jgi:anti-anti-sigma factor
MESGLVVSQVNDVTVVTFRSPSILEMTAVEAVGEQLYKLVDRQARRKVLLNMQAVRFWSSQMISVLLNLHKKAGQIDGKVVICSLRPELRKVFKVTNLHRVLNFAKDEDEAMSMLGAVPSR